jgi:uncharacterized protein DUF1566
MNYKQSIMIVLCLLNADLLIGETKRSGSSQKLKYSIVGTGQERCYDNRKEIKYPWVGKAYYGQDAQYKGNIPKYKDNGDGTVTDLITGLMWQKNPGSKKTLKEAVKGASKCRTGGYNDWRLPTIKEQYSLILFSGMDPDPRNTDTSGLQPFIDTQYFDFKYGDTNNFERIIDSQYATSTEYVHKTMRGDDTMFGVNFADGRIKGYPIKDPRGRGDKKFYVQYVRNNKNYGKNIFIDNHDGTITDKATGLTWMKMDSGHLKAGKNKDGKLNWEEALEWAENLKYAKKSDWRLPNAKELQSIVDYSRSPATTKSAAIDKVFKVSNVKEDGKNDFPYYWTGTTHVKGAMGSAAVYISFGTGFGWMQDRRSGKKTLMDVHGAGCQRSDPKSGDPSRYPYGRGPQGDVIRINNFVRCVREGTAVPNYKGPKIRKVNSRRQRPEQGPEERPEDGPRREPGGDDRNNRFIKRLDKDGDGKVSKKEFDGPSRHFGHFDKDGDGFISGDEGPTGPPKGR